MSPREAVAMYNFIFLLLSATPWLIDNRYLLTMRNTALDAERKAELTHIF